MEVGFLVVGAQKGGTSALAEFLSVHPQICMAEFLLGHSRICTAESKEVHFFDLGALSPGRPSNYEEYHSFFPKKPGAIAYGEATPAYMYWKPAAERIYRYNPEMKLIFLLRNPVERAYSKHQEEQSRMKN